jgi:hypothetical protein
LMARVCRKGPVLLTLPAVFLFMTLEFLPALPIIERFIDRTPPRLKLAHSHPAENAGAGAGVAGEEAILYRTYADGDGP